jgi:hypothetical protein
VFAIVQHWIMDLHSANGTFLKVGNVELSCHLQHILLIINTAYGSYVKGPPICLVRSAISKVRF